MWWAALGGYLLIFFARIADVSLATVRTLLLVRGRRLPAGLIGFFEVSIYIMALSRVMGELSHPLNLLFYAAGFATGNVVGSLVEEKLAVGTVMVQVISREGGALQAADVLRADGFGVTVVDGHGREGDRPVLLVGMQRKVLPRFLKRIDGLLPGAFVTVLDSRQAMGGVLGFRNEFRKQK